MTLYCKEKQRKSSESGITIIALVVTIAVLLILAGVSITSLVGSEGVIDSTKKSVNEVVSTEDELNNNLNDLINKVDEQLSTETEEPTPPDTIDN